MMYNIIKYETEYKGHVFIFIIYVHIIFYTIEVINMYMYPYIGPRLRQCFVATAAAAAATAAYTFLNWFFFPRVLRSYVLPVTSYRVSVNRPSATGVTGNPGQYFRCIVALYYSKRCIATDSARLKNYIEIIISYRQPLNSKNSFPRGPRISRVQDQNRIQIDTIKFVFKFFRVEFQNSSHALITLILRPQDLCYNIFI